MLLTAPYVPAAAAERSLEPDPSPAAAAESGLRPDSFGPLPARAAQIGPTAPALAVQTPSAETTPVRTVPVQTVPVQPKLHVAETPRAVETPPAVHISSDPRESIAKPSTRIVSKATPSRHHAAQAARKQARPRVASLVPLLATRGSFVFRAVKATLDSARPTPEATARDGGLALPAALAVLLLAAASGCFLSLAYRLRRDQAEV